MKLRFVTAIAVVALIAFGCGDSSQPVATVNGRAITADYMASLHQGSGATLDVNTEEFRAELTRNIIRISIEQAAASEFGIRVTGEELAERIANPPPRWQALFDEMNADPDVTDVLIESQAELSILRDRVTAELIRRSDGYMERTISDSPQELTSGCLRHILVDSALEATAAVDRLEAGEDFATVAAELTTDTASGGNLVGGCPVEFSQFVAPFASAAALAPLNTVVGPVQTEFGFHVILVEERSGPPTIEELTSDPVGFYPESTLSSFFTPWFNDAVRASTIEVAEPIGQWSSAAVGIAPPESR